MPQQGKYFCKGKNFVCIRIVPRSNLSAACRGKANTFEGQKYSKPRRLKPLQGRFVQWQMSTYCKAFEATFRLTMGRSNKYRIPFAFYSIPSRARYRFVSRKIAAPSFLWLAMTLIFVLRITQFYILSSIYHNLFLNYSLLI